MSTMQAFVTSKKETKKILNTSKPSYLDCLKNPLKDKVFWIVLKVPQKSYLKNHKQEFLWILHNTSF